MTHKFPLAFFLLTLLSSPVLYAQNIDVIPETRETVKLSFAPLVKKISPAVVNIYTKRVVTQRISPFANDPLFSQFFGGGFSVPQKRLEQSLGSGVIIEEDGLVITNAHVVKDASEITIALTDGREFPAKILLKDEASDLALLHIDSNEKLPTAKLQPSETLEVGDLVLAIGNPFGVGQTVTSGIVSALARSSLSINDLNFFIQTDAAINPGNSGGPLISTDGGVVGINSAIYSRDGGSLGIGFSIPSEMVASILAAYKSGQISESGQIRRPWVGISAQNVTADIATSLGLSHPSGALISALHEASPAKDAGLKVGDVVISVNGHKVRDAAEMRFRLAMTALGDTSGIEVWNKGETRTLHMKSIAPPDVPERNTQTIKERSPLLGATIMNLNPAVGIELGLKIAPEQGVVVGGILPNSPARQFLQKGDILLEINGLKVTSVEDALKAIKRKAPQGWTFRILSNGQERDLVVR
ncbi:MAG TPA: Do family serine endopeptidase [Alphaproteobacteria bacterium]|nr:Do family serine endopeptidase [Alphaproteobacteria bacterium]HNS44917.1 Do family serine endopeptidase [Alphaproteobacteria bacterium]